jgi:hypothetical protein
MHQKNVFRAIRIFMEKCRIGEWSLISIVPNPFVRTASGKIRGKGPDEVREEVRRIISNAGISLFLGGLDASYNEDSRLDISVRFAEHWSWHVFGIAPTQEITPEVYKRLHRGFESSPAVPKPIWTKPFDGRDAALMYIMKPNFCRRVTAFRKELGKNDRRRVTRKRPLRPWQAEAIRSILSELCVEDRLVLVGAKAVRNSADYRLTLERDRSFANDNASRKVEMFTNAPFSRLQHGSRFRNDVYAAEQGIEKLQRDVSDSRYFPRVARGVKLHFGLTRCARGFRRTERFGEIVVIQRKVLADIVGEGLVDAVLDILAAENLLLLDGDKRTRKVQAAGLGDDNRQRRYCFHYLGLVNRKRRLN